jgi:hypothetical protein
MSDIFPKWTNKLPRQIIIGALLMGTATIAGVTYYFTPQYTRVGYEPIQPVAFPHSVHVKQLGLDCRYCHNGVEKSWYSNIPATSVCMNCHTQVLKDDPRLAVVRESNATGKPIEWVQIHKLPDYAYFNHSVHVNRGVSCVECHGQINDMDVVYHAKPLSMSFCLDCHRDPAMHLRPLDKITDLDWKPTQDARDLAAKQLTLGSQIVHDWKVQSLQTCSTCHR